MKEKNEVLLGSVKQLKQDLSEITERYNEAKDTLKSTETNCNQLYQQLSKLNADHMGKL